MDHDNIITMCYINAEAHEADHGESEDMANFDAIAFKASILDQCKGKQTCNAMISNSITGIEP